MENNAEKKEGYDGSQRKKASTQTLTEEYLKYTLKY
jgi:hypothetical protein